MPRLSWRFDGPSDGDGAVGHKYLMDISEKLSEHYGRLIRQGQNFTVKSVDIRAYNPDTTVEDEVLAVSGKLVYFEPTRNRAKAWANAFSAWLTNRRSLGVTGRGADFRVGLAEDYSTDVGMFNTGVKFNAWINADDNPLMLGSALSPKDSIFTVYNENVAVNQEGPTNPNGGFGHWAAKDTDSAFDELDFVCNENTYYREGEASPHAQVLPFMVNFSAWFDNASSDPDDFGSASNAEHIVGNPVKAMCGVVGIYVDTVVLDDSLTENQNYGIEISMDIERWTPILPKRRKKRGRR